MAEIQKWKIENGRLVNPENLIWIEYNLPLTNILLPLWHINNNQMTNPLNSIWLTEYMIPKYPNIFWNIQSNNTLEHNNKEWLIGYMIPKYPNVIWTIKNENMERNELFTYEFLGGFYNSTLSNIEIPSTVNKIGERAFYNTRLSTITIPINCEYSKNSFPIDCKINVK